ncbi:MAG TPA: plasmid pRiA4b ORF-3 family protein [Candidatus Cybelea sp.]
MASIVWRVTVRLTGVMPIVWRTLLVRPDTKLAMLHRYLQAAMGWREYHFYMFTIADKKYTMPNREWSLDQKVHDARRYTLARLFLTLPTRFEYLYDFGDHWEHTIEIEGEEAAAYRKQYPICIDGAEPCPPEDVGGPPGYRQLLEVIRDPHHPEHDELKRWAESKFYPHRFWAQEATWQMRDVQRGLI